MSEAPPPSRSEQREIERFGVFTEEKFAESVRRFGVDHTHDLDCRTWRGENWAGACNCTLDDRVADLAAS